jgi:hypothetical protein
MAPVERTVNTEVPSDTGGEASGPSNGFSQRETGGNGEEGGSGRVFEQADIAARLIRSGPRIRFEFVRKSPVKASEV